MSEAHLAKSQTLPPHVLLMQMVMGVQVGRVVLAAAKLGLADHLEARPRSAEELAGPLRVHAPTGFCARWPAWASRRARLGRT